MTRMQCVLRRAAPARSPRRRNDAAHWLADGHQQLLHSGWLPRAYTRFDHRAITKSPKHAVPDDRGAAVIGVALAEVG